MQNRDNDSSFDVQFSSNDQKPNFEEVKSFFQIDFSEKSDIGQSKNKKVNEEEGLKKYWESCNNDCRIITICLQFSFFVFQIKGIFFPIEGSNQRVVNMGYMLLTFVCILLIYLSYRKKNGSYYIYVSMVLATIRSSGRLLDFEKTRDKLSDIQWNLLF